MNIEDLKQFGIKGSKNGLLIVEVSSKWCISCPLLECILEKFRDEHLIKFEKIDLDLYPSVIQSLNITAMPLLLFFRDGKLLSKDIRVNDYNFVKHGRMAGVTCENVIMKIIEKL